MSWQTPLWTCGRADWAAAYDDGSDAPQADKPELAAPDESTVSKDSPELTQPTSP